MPDIAELVVRIKADASQLQQELAKTTGSVKQSSNEMSAGLMQVKSAMDALLPAFSAAALIQFGKSSIDSAENLTHMADRIGFTVQTLSALEPSLKKNGSSVDEFATSVNFLNRNLGLAASGNAPQMVAKFDQMGLSVTKLMAMNPEQRFFAVAQALGQIKDQSTLASDAFLVMGRGVAGLLPTLKETGGNFDEVISKAKQLGQVITPEQEKQVRAFESAWVDMVAQMKISMLDAMPVLQLYLAGITGIINLPSNALNAGRQIGDILANRNPNVSTTRPKTVDQATSVSGYTFDAKGNLQAPNGATGSNDDITQQKAQTSKLQEYIDTLHGESEALKDSKLSEEVYKAEKQATTDALDDYNNKLRTTKDLTEQERITIASSVVSYQTQEDAIKQATKAQEESIQMAARMKSEIASSLADIIMHYKNFGQTVAGVLQQITKQIIEMEITQPFTNAIGGALGSATGSFNFGNLAAYAGMGEQYGPAMQGFASGGSPPVGVPSIVGENGPEIFVPSQQGTIIPNHSFGGTTIHQTLQFNMQPGLPETVNAAIRNAAPQIIDAAHSATMAAIQKGGADSRAVGRRSQ